MNKALRFVWLSLLTLICGVASAGTVVFDPTQASDVTTGGGTTITKNGITLTITQQNQTYPSSFDATTKDGKVCYSISPNSQFTISSNAPAGNITAITFEFFWDENQQCGLYECASNKYGHSLSTGVRCAFADNGFSSVLMKLFWGSAYITKLTVEYDGGEDPDPGPGPGGDEAQTTTIAQLMQGGGKCHFCQHKVYQCTGCLCRGKQLYCS